jgi:hypothetical protein
LSQGDGAWEFSYNTEKTQKTPFPSVWRYCHFPILHPRWMRSFDCIQMTRAPARAVISFISTIDLVLLVGSVISNQSWMNPTGLFCHFSKLHRRNLFSKPREWNGIWGCNL